MSYHMDKESNITLIRLLDALCMWERETGRRNTLILIPHNPDEEIVLAQDGKPVPTTVGIRPTLTRQLVDLALKERDRLNEVSK
jgi:uncharacterized protein YjiS (DUF1127 family)